MGKSRATGTFISRTYIVVNGDRDDRNSIVLIKKNAEAVAEGIFLDLNGLKFKGFGHKNTSSQSSETKIS
jgi:hypothetical protein